MKIDINILLILSAKLTLKGIDEHLRVHGYTVYITDSGQQGIWATANRKPDMILLGAALDDMSEGEALARIRALTTVPIIMLSDHATEEAIIRALNAGANDYLTQPLGLDELGARIRAHLRRRHSTIPAIESAFQFGDIVFDRLNRRVKRLDHEIHLTRTEFRLLSILARHPGRTVTRNELLSEVWGTDQSNKGHYLRLYFGQLRKKLEADPAHPRHLITEPGVGYRLVVGEGG